MIIRLFPEDESDKLSGKLVFSVNGRPTSREFRFPSVFQHPTQLVCEPVGKRGSKTWLLLATQETNAETIGFCLRIDGSAHSVKMMFADHSGIVPSKSNLKRGIIVESKLAKWLYGGAIDGNTDDEFARVGHYAPAKDEFTFGPWKRSE
jgi:hypothetical protein